MAATIRCLFFIFLLYNVFDHERMIIYIGWNHLTQNVCTDGTIFTSAQIIRKWTKPKPKQSWSEAVEWEILFSVQFCDDFLWSIMYYSLQPSCWLVSFGGILFRAGSTAPVQKVLGNAGTAFDCRLQAWSTVGAPNPADGRFSWPPARQPLLLHSETWPVPQTCLIP